MLLLAKLSRCRRTLVDCHIGIRIVILPLCSLLHFDQIASCQRLLETLEFFTRRSMRATTFRAGEAVDLLGDETLRCRLFRESVLSLILSVASERVVKTGAHCIL